MPATFQVTTLHGLSPATGHAQEASANSSIEVAALRDSLGVTVVEKPKKQETSALLPERCFACFLGLGAFRGLDKRWERLHEIGGEREDAFENLGGDFLGLAVGVADHFEFGVEVVDVMEGEGLGRARQDRRAELIVIRKTENSLRMADDQQ
jgi:hypothetical protein